MESNMHGSSSCPSSQLDEDDVLLFSSSSTSSCSSSSPSSSSVSSTSSTCGFYSRPPPSFSSSSFLPSSTNPPPALSTCNRSSFSSASSSFSSSNLLLNNKTNTSLSSRKEDDAYMPSSTSSSSYLPSSCFLGVSTTSPYITSYAQDNGCSFMDEVSAAAGGGNNESPIRCMEWRSVRTEGHMPAQRSLHIAVVCNNCMYIFGGYDGGNRLNDLHKYDFELNKWTQVFPQRQASNSTPSSVFHTLSSSVLPLAPSSSSLSSSSSSSSSSPRVPSSAALYHMPSSSLSNNNTSSFDMVANNSSRDSFGMANNSNSSNTLITATNSTNNNNSFSPAPRPPPPPAHVHVKGPSPRDRHAAVVHGRKIYIFGGYDGGSRKNDLWYFDTEENIWVEMLPSSAVMGEDDSSVINIGTGGGTVLGVPPSPRHSHAAVEYVNCMYIFGGYDGNYRADLHEYNFFLRKWTNVVYRGGNIPQCRYRTSAVVWQNKMIVFGGHDGKKHLNDFYEFNFDDKIWCSIDIKGINPPPLPRDSHIAVILDDSLFLFGGSTGRASNDLHEFRLDTREWRPINFLKKQPSVQSSSLASSAYIAYHNNNDIHVGGGTEDSNAGYIPCPRFCHTGVVYDKSLYIFGGYDGQNRLNDFKAIQLAKKMRIVIPPSTLVSDMKGYINDEKFSDVSFYVEGRIIYAHKIMCIRSKYFKAMFNSEMREAIQNTPIHIHNVKYNIFLLLLEYLYTDNVDIDIDTCIDLFIISDKFDIQRLKKMCEAFILSSIDVCTASSILLAADTHNADNLRQTCIDFILRNFDAVSKTKSFEEMIRSSNGTDLLLEILKRR